MKYLSVCSGIEAATVAWHPLGWRPFAFSEIEPFPSAVLAHHYPDVPNLGDMTRFKEWPDADLDLLVGGTPCQSFSVAGLRKGLDDPRGNLALTYLAIAEQYRPRWLVWENVPGVLSSNGGRDFGAFLGMLEELNYIVDVDILDAQYFGLAQRRRRVFVCAQHLDNLLKQNTNSSALTITQCLMEILQGILVEAFPAFARLPESSEFARVSRDGVLRRIKLFKLLGEEGHWQMLLSNLAGALARCQAEAKNLVERDGEKGKDLTAEDLLTVLKADLPSLPTEESLSKSLGDVYAAMKLFTTSTSTSITTTLQISLFKAALNIARLTLHLSGLSPSSSDSESSNLMALREYTNYARQTSSDLFAGMEWVCSGGDLIGEAEQYEEAFGHLRDWRAAAAVLFERHSLSGHPAPRREKGQGAAADVAPSLTASGRGVERTGETRGQDPVVAMCLNAKGGSGRMDAESETFVAHTLRGEGFDASEDGTGRGTPLVPAIAPTMMANGDAHSGYKDEHGLVTVAFAENSRAEIRLEGGDGSRTGSLSTGGGKPGQGVPMVAYTGESYADAYEADASSALSTLRKAVGKKAFCKWGLGVLASLQSPEILRAWLHGAVLREQAENFKSVVDDRALPRQEGSAGRTLRALWEHGPDGSSPQGRGLAKQLAGKPGEGLSVLPPEGASTESDVQLVREAREGARLLREALSALQEVGQPAHGQAQPAQQAHAVRRLTPREAERLQGFPDDYTLIPWRGKPADQCPDGPRYKALGNSMAVPCMAWIGSRIALMGELKGRAAA